MNHSTLGAFRTSPDVTSPATCNFTTQVGSSGRNRRRGRNGEWVVFLRDTQLARSVGHVGPSLRSLLFFCFAHYAPQLCRCGRTRTLPIPVYAGQSVRCLLAFKEESHIALTLQRKMPFLSAKCDGSSHLALDSDTLTRDRHPGPTATSLYLRCDDSHDGLPLHCSQPGVCHSPALATRPDVPCGTVQPAFVHKRSHAVPFRLSIRYERGAQRILAMF